MNYTPSTYFFGWCPNFACCFAEVKYLLHEKTGGAAYYRGTCPECGCLLSLSARPGSGLPNRREAQDA